MKLSALTCIIIGVSLFVIAVSFGYFHSWLPNNTEAGYWKTYSDQLAAEEAKVPQVEKRLKDAEADVDAKTVDWKKVVDTRTPPTSIRQGGIDIGVNAWQLPVDTLPFRDSIQRAVNAQVKVGGVKLVSDGPFVPHPSQNGTDILSTFYNYPAKGFPVVMFDFGTITVTGTYKQICDNVRAYSHMPHYLAVCDGLAITGTAPQLQATYSLSIVGFVRGDKIFPPVEGADALAMAATTAPATGTPAGNAAKPTGAPGDKGPGRPGGANNRGATRAPGGDRGTSAPSAPAGKNARGVGGD